MEARKVETVRGWQWFAEGLRLYGKSPGNWILMSVLFLTGMIVVSIIPVVGYPLASLLAPVVVAGFMLGCRDLQLGRKLVVGHLFAGFGERAPQLVAVGGMSFISQTVIVRIMHATGGGKLVDILMGQVAVDNPDALAQAITEAGLSIVIGAALFAVLVMALQFAPALALFNRISAFESLKSSLQACLVNILPLSVYGAVLLGLTMVSVLAPFIGMIILTPLVFSTTYAAYLDIFPPSTPSAGEQPETQGG